MKELKIKGKTHKFPIFLPDATLGVVRSLDSEELVQIGTRGVVVNTYHLITSPGLDVLKRVGGIKNYMKFDGLVVSDSGGWQVFSMIHRKGNEGKITDRGVTFGIGPRKRKLFTPVDSIQTQFRIGSDIMICLDDFSPPKGTKEQVNESVNRTTLWAKKSKEEYERLLYENDLKSNERPLLFGVVQGAGFKDLRKKSAEELVQLGFDGYGFGGYLIDDEGNLDYDMLEYLSGLIPDDKPKFALGTGAPYEIARCYFMGWQIFDCTLPTRDARHKRLYVFNKDPKDFTKEGIVDPSNYGFVYIDREKHKNSDESISEFCDCFTCKNYSKSYLRHLFEIKDFLAFRLATIHNLRHYNILIQKLSDFDAKF